MMRPESVHEEGVDPGSESRDSGLQENTCYICKGEGHKGFQCTEACTMPGCDEHTAAKCPLWQKRAAEAVTLRLSAMQGERMEAPAPSASPVHPQRDAGFDPSLHQSAQEGQGAPQRQTETPSGEKDLTVQIDPRSIHAAATIFAAAIATDPSFRLVHESRAPPLLSTSQSRPPQGPTVPSIETSRPTQPALEQESLRLQNSLGYLKMVKSFTTPQVYERFKGILGSVREGVISNGEARDQIHDLFAGNDLLVRGFDQLLDPQQRRSAPSGKQIVTCRCYSRPCESCVCAKAGTPCHSGCHGGRKVHAACRNDGSEVNALSREASMISFLGVQAQATAQRGSDVPRPLMLPPPSDALTEEMEDEGEEVTEKICATLPALGPLEMKAFELGLPELEEKLRNEEAEEAEEWAKQEAERLQRAQEEEGEQRAEQVAENLQREQDERTLQAEEQKERPWGEQEEIPRQCDDTSPEVQMTSVPGRAATQREDPCISQRGIEPAGFPPAAVGPHAFSYPSDIAPSSGSFASSPVLRAALRDPSDNMYDFLGTSVRGSFSTPRFPPAVRQSMNSGLFSQQPPSPLMPLPSNRRITVTLGPIPDARTLQLQNARNANSASGIGPSHATSHQSAPHATEASCLQEVAASLIRSAGVEVVMEENEAEAEDMQKSQATESTSLEGVSERRTPGMGRVVKFMCDGRVVHWAVVFLKEEVAEEMQEQVSDDEDGTAEMLQTPDNRSQPRAAAMPPLLPTSSEEATRLNKVRRATGTELTSKYCTLCMTDKKVGDYCESKRGFLGRHSRCRACHGSRQRNSKAKRDERTKLEAARRGRLEMQREAKEDEVEEEDAKEDTMDEKKANEDEVGKREAKQDKVEEAQQAEFEPEVEIEMEAFADDVASIAEVNLGAHLIVTPADRKELARFREAQVERERAKATLVSPQPLSSPSTLVMSQPPSPELLPQSPFPTTSAASSLPSQSLPSHRELGQERRKRKRSRREDSGRSRSGSSRVSRHSRSRSHNRERDRGWHDDRGQTHRRDRDYYRERDHRKHHKQHRCEQREKNAKIAVEEKEELPPSPPQLSLSSPQLPRSRESAEGLPWGDYERSRRISSKSTTRRKSKSRSQSRGESRSWSWAESRSCSRSRDRREQSKLKRRAKRKTKHSDRSKKHKKRKHRSTHSQSESRSQSPAKRRKKSRRTRSNRSRQRKPIQSLSASHSESRHAPREQRSGSRGGGAAEAGDKSKRRRGYRSHSGKRSGSRSRSNTKKRKRSTSKIRARSRQREPSRRRSRSVSCHKPTFSRWSGSRDEGGSKKRERQ